MYHYARQNEMECSARVRHYHGNQTKKTYLSIRTKAAGSLEWGEKVARSRIDYDRYCKSEKCLVYKETNSKDRLINSCLIIYTLNHVEYRNSSNILSFLWESGERRISVEIRMQAHIENQYRAGIMQSVNDWLRDGRQRVSLSPCSLNEVHLESYPGLSGAFTAMVKQTECEAGRLIMIE